MTYFHFYIGNKSVKLSIAGPDGAVQEEAVSPLNFEDNLFSALNVLHRLMSRGGGRGSYQPDREFIRKIGGIQASLLNLTASDPAAPVEVQVLFSKHWTALQGEAGGRACFTFDFAQDDSYAELAELPWEFLSLHDTELAINGNLACDFIRKIPAGAGATTPVPLSKKDPLQLLLIISEPDAEAFRRSDKALVAYRESYVYRLLRVYENLATKQRVRLRVLYQPRQVEVQKAQLQSKAVEFGAFLEWFQQNMVEPDSNPVRNNNGGDFQPQVIHFFGHVTTDERDDEVIGCINDTNGLAYASFEEFAACMAVAKPALLILQSPEGVKLHRSKYSRKGLLAELAQKKLPYILSFQHPLSEQGGLAFLLELYQCLFDAKSVPVAVSSGRVRLSRESGSDANAFGSPALYATLPYPGPLHYRLIAGQEAGGAPGEPAAVEMQVDKMTLPEKIEWYGRETRRLVENSELEMALDKCREIILIAARSPDTDQPRVQGYQNQLSLLINRFNDVKKSFEKGDIDYKERSRQYLSIGNNLLEYFLPSGLPGITKKTSDPEKTQVTSPKTAAKTEDFLDSVR